MDLDGIGACAFDGSCVSTDVSASVSGLSSLSPKYHDYKVIDSDLLAYICKLNANFLNHGVESVLAS